MLKRFKTLSLTFLTHPDNAQPSLSGLSLQALYAGLFGEERPRPMLMWLALLVTLLHVLVAQKLRQPTPPLIQAKPLMMEVALISAAAPKQAETVTQPVAQPKPEPPKKKPLKPLKKKPKPLVHKPVDIPKKPALKPIKAPAPVQEAEPEEAPVQSPPAPVKAAPPKVATAPNKAEVFTEANFQANYGYNPKPVYPSIARRERWEGKVTLRVRVSAEGYSDDVSVQRSSGHEELDDAAVAAVKKWRFIPAKRGSTPVSSSVLVPIIFNLHH